MILRTHLDTSHLLWFHRDYFIGIKFPKKQQFPELDIDSEYRLMRDGEEPPTAGEEENKDLVHMTEKGKPTAPCGPGHLSSTAEHC